jgi:N-acetylglucosamine kinase-like BadF-type ATPase
MTSASRPDRTPLIVGIDIGGTKTHLKITQGEHAREVIHSSPSWRKRHISEDAESLLKMVDQLAEGSVVDAIGIGAHGCDDALECLAFQQEFSARTKTPVEVVNDAELMPLALGFKNQIGVVAGTGSIAVCREASGEMLVAGGWGWAIGDEGSAAGLVREAAKAIALHLDLGGSMDEPLCQGLFKAMDIPGVPRIGSTLANLGTAAAIGSHARTVFDAAQAGSELAQQVIKEGGMALADLVQRLVARGAVGRHVVAGGSVIASQPLLWTAFETATQNLAGPALTPHLFKGKPVEGACILAQFLIEEPTATAARVQTN